jgi:hypothetical protein
VQIMLTPERPPRVQWVNLPVPPAPGSALASALNAVVAWMNGDGACPVADAASARRLRAAAAWAGECRVAAYTAGDGEVATTAELAGQHAVVSLSVTVDPATGQVSHASVSWEPS